VGVISNVEPSTSFERVAFEWHGLSRAGACDQALCHGWIGRAVPARGTGLGLKSGARNIRPMTWSATATPTACAEPEPMEEPPRKRTNQPEGWRLYLATSGDRNRNLAIDIVETVVRPPCPIPPASIGSGLPTLAVALPPPADANGSRGRGPGRPTLRRAGQLRRSPPGHRVYRLAMTPLQPQCPV
jgi:hypothetical protein